MGFHTNLNAAPDVARQEIPIHLQVQDLELTEEFEQRLLEGHRRKLETETAGCVRRDCLFQR